MSDLGEDFLAHFGIKGMKWGIRKSDAPAAPEFSPSALTFHGKATSRTVTLKNGGSLTMQADPTPGLARFIARHHKGTDERIKNGASFSLKDSVGNTVGDMQLYKESPTSMNVIWVGVKNEARGNGYASGAMDGAINFARAQKLKTVTLEVPGNAPDARHIYEKKGFKVVHEATQDEIKEDPAWGGLTTMKLDLDAQHSAVDAEEFLAHFGVKGMRWGVRKDNVLRGATSVHGASEDAVKAQTAQEKAKVSGLHALSNTELQALVTRQNLEQNYARLNPERVNAGRNFAKTVGTIGTNAAKNATQTKAQNLLGKGLDVATDAAVKAIVKQTKAKLKKP